MKNLIVVIIGLLFLFISSPAIAGEIITADKLITVDTAKQMIYVWEGGKNIYQSKASTGLPLTPTVKGSFTIRRKVPTQTMRGGSKAYGKYEYKNVPNVMYFYQGYAFHGAYWHNRFGKPASHGCVNLPLDAATWLYNWAPAGTRVEVF